jgi:hypothetical protein
MVAPVMYMPQMVPSPIPFQPTPLPALPMLPLHHSNSLPAINPPLFYNGASFTELPTNLKSLNNEGQLIAPPGYSFVTMSVPSASVERRSASVDDAVLPEVDSLPIPALSERSRSRSSSVVSVPEELPAAEPTKTEAPAKPANKKFRHRSKQMRILEVHAKLKEEYTAKGLYAGDDEVLRGFDTVRVHVKTYKALNRIECPLNDVEKHPEIEVLKIATPFSMKNRFQKKGFIVYLKLASDAMVPLVQDIFSRYKEDFAKCDVALKKEDKQRMDRRNASLRSRGSSISMSDMSSLSEMPSTDFLSTRAYSREGYECSDWAMPMGA